MELVSTTACKPSFSLHLHTDGAVCCSDENLHECESQPCQNGGVCIDRESSYLCDCPPSFDGDDCEVPLVLEHCADGGMSPCLNGGTCHTEHGGVVCDCASGYSGHTCAHSSDIGWGTTVDITRLHRSDGEVALNFRPIFSDAAQDQIVRTQRPSASGVSTVLWADAVEMMSAAVQAVGVEYENGMLTSDVWIASMRQQSFTLRPTPRRLGRARRTYTSYTDSYPSTLPLHPDFVADVEELPRSLVGDGAEAYERFLDEFGTHYVSQKRFGGDMTLTFFV